MSDDLPRKTWEALQMNHLVADKSVTRSDKQRAREC